MLDWKSRFKNKTFILAIVSSMVLLIQQLGLDILPPNFEEILNTILTILVTLGVVVDPTTSGITDGMGQ